MKPSCNQVFALAKKYAMEKAAYMSVKDLMENYVENYLDAYAYELNEIILDIFLLKNKDLDATKAFMVASGIPSEDVDQLILLSRNLQIMPLQNHEEGL